MIGNKIQPFKIWCQKVLPNVYDDSLSYYEYLCKMNEYLNEVIEQMNTLTEAEEQFQESMNNAWEQYQNDLNDEWDEYKTELTEQWNTYKNYIDNYFDNLDVQTEINNKLDEMASDGTLDALLLPYFNTYKSEINQIVATQNGKIDVLEGRVDEITTLPSGSTSGDAELADIRVPQSTFNGGSNYANAGDAVRGQVGTLQKYGQIEELHTNNVLNIAKYNEIKFDTFLQGYYQNNQFYSDNGQITTEYMKLPSGYIKVTCNDSTQIVVNEYELGLTGIQRTGHTVQSNEVIVNHDETKFITFGLYNNQGVEPSDGTKLHAVIFNFADKSVEAEIASKVGAEGYADLKGIMGATINEYGTITNVTNQYSLCGLIKFPKGSHIIAQTLVEGTVSYIKTFTYSNGSFSRTSNLSEGAVTQVTADGESYYSIAIFKGSAFNKPLDTEYKILVVKEDKMCYAKVSASSLRVLYKDIAYTIYHQVDASINIDSWRLYKGVCNGTEMWNNSDAEGPIKLVGDSDFISGYHGDEIVQNVSVYIDNVAIDLTKALCGVCNNVALYQESKCYKADTEIEAFTRYKRVMIENANYDVQQKWIALIDCQIQRGALCLFQCPKSILNGWDSDILLPRHSNDGTTSMQGATKGTMYVGKHTFELIAENGQQYDGYTSLCEDFTSRLKFYFDMYNGKSLSIGDVINSKFRVVVDEV